MSFTVRLTLALLVALLAAALIAPWVAAIVAALGFRFPFPRIFDRVVMVALAVVMLQNARRLGLGRRLGIGFANPGANLGRILRGLAIAIAAVAALWIVAVVISGGKTSGFARLWAHMPGTLAAALIIAVMEEAFFRAFVLNGMRDDFASTPALVLNSAVYAFAHLLRSPARFYLDGLHPLAGFQVLAASFSQLGHSAEFLPALIGLFLLGLLLGRAFLLTGTVYFSIGLHAGFVVGAKSWRIVAPPSGSLPMWLVGYTRPPLISGLGAWVIALALLLLIKPLTGRPAKA
jgi:membrane protease YdiL (CAAX protease family)